MAVFLAVELLLDFLAVELEALAFLAGAFFAGAFLAGAFLAGAFFAGAFLAGAFFAAVELLLDFFAVDELEELDFFAGAFLAVDELAALVFFVVVFFAGDADFLAVDEVFFAVVDAFFAGAFLAVEELDDVAFLATSAAFFAGAVAFFATSAAFFPALELRALDTARSAGFGSLGSFLAPETTALRSAPAVNFGTAVFFAFTRSPVRGLRTQRASRMRFSKDPKPVIATFSPRATSRVMVSSTDSRACCACLRFPS